MTADDTETPEQSLVFDCPGEVFNEVCDPQGGIRPHWQRLVSCLREVPHAEFSRRITQAEVMLRDNGVTYHAFTDSSRQARPWQLDLLPLVLASHEWREIQDGLRQRARLMNCLINDIFGPQDLIRRRLLPPEIVFANPEFLRPFMHLTPQETHPLFLYAGEMARAPSGEWFVMADRTEAPAGPGFALENRVVVSRTVPAALRQIHPQRLPPFFNRLKDSLLRRSRRDGDSPRVVMLTHGPAHQYYFEDVYLARYLGYTLVEPGDLAVRNDAVYLKTLGGLMPVDLILSRHAEMQLDPLELRDAGDPGIPGLLHAVRRGNVTIANTPGCGILGAPVFMAFLPKLCQELLGETLRIPSIATWWYGDPAGRALIDGRLSELVVKPAFRKSGGQEYVISEMSSADTAALRQQMSRQPWAWVAQERILRSGVPVRADSGFRCGHVALRTFLVEDDGEYHLMPGGLVRVAPDTRPLQLSASAGDGSKDLWILPDPDAPPVTLIAPLYQPATLQRTTALFPSRVADNLFWLGRNMDRIDMLARVLRALLERLSGERDSEVSDVSFLSRVLDALSDPGSESDEKQPDAPATAATASRPLPESVPFTARHAQALSRAVSELERLASLVRDWLSPDTWSAIVTLAEGYQPAPVDPGQDLSDGAAVLNELIRNAAAVTGLIADGMNRGPSWRFLELGRRIERTIGTSQLLQSADLQRAPTAAAVLKAIIEVLDVQMTYRFRYRDQLQRNAVLDLGITDTSNPRSLVFQIDRIVAQIHRLPAARHEPLRNEEERVTMACAHAVRMLDSDDLAAAGAAAVVEALKEARSAAERLSSVLTRKYLVHAGHPRRIEDLYGGRQ